MILTIDVGNTSTAFGLFDGDKSVLRFRRTTNVNSSSDETGVFLRSVLRENGFDWQQIEKKAYLAAMEKSPYNASYIKQLLLSALTDKTDDREVFMKGIDYSYYYETIDD